jgi:hypothetical protein
MATKKKSSQKQKALRDYIELAREFALQKDIHNASKDAMDLLAPKIRTLALEAGLDDSKEQPQVDDNHIVETRFSTSESYDTDRLMAWLKARKLKKVIKQCFTVEEIPAQEARKIYVFDKKAFEKLDESGDIPDREDLEDGDDPIYTVKDLTPSIYVHETESAKEARLAASKKARQRAITAKKKAKK